MKVDFFASRCEEATQTNKKFGICDDDDGSKAYTSTTNDTDWVATVINENEHEVKFSAIDNCISIVKDGSGEKESTCDGMLVFSDSLYLIELKKQTKDWMPKAKEQLKNTIELLQKHTDLSRFKHKKAFGCNKKHPQFAVLEAAEKKKLFDETGFRFDMQAEIKIK